MNCVYLCMGICGVAINATLVLIPACQLMVHKLIIGISVIATAPPVHLELDNVTGVPCWNITTCFTTHIPHKQPEPLLPASYKRQLNELTILNEDIRAEPQKKMKLSDEIRKSKIKDGRVRDWWELKEDKGCRTDVDLSLLDKKLLLVCKSAAGVRISFVCGIVIYQINSDVTIKCHITKIGMFPEQQLRHELVWPFSGFVDIIRIGFSFSWWFVKKINYGP